METENPRLLQLLRLASPLLPVGAYSYSQGLEWAVEAGWVHDWASAGTWIGHALTLNLARFEAPVLWRLLKAWLREDDDAVVLWNTRLLTGRDSAEFYAETVQMGYSLSQLLNELGEFPASQLAPLNALEPVSFPTAYAFAAAAWRLAPHAALTAYLWAWAENQVAAAIKLIPLGQVAGQKLLSTLLPMLDEVRHTAMTIPYAQLSTVMPRLALASCRHERQYSRLFRS